jgi:hypothetical protein
MLEFIEKFNNLPAEVKQRISSGETMARIEELEKKYGVALASFVMRVMTGDLYYKNITANLIIEFNLAPEKAVELEKELQKLVFANVANYLSGGKISPVAVAPEAKKSSIPAVSLPKIPAIMKTAVEPMAAKNFLQEDETDIAAMGEITDALKPYLGGKTETMLEEIVSEANINFPSEDLMKRFRDALSTYLRGVRAKVEVREILLKEVASGGVKLSEQDADRVLNIAQKKLDLNNQTFVGPGKVNARSTADGTNFTFNEEEIKQALEERKGMPARKPADSGIAGSRDVGYDFAALNKKKATAEENHPQPLLSKEGGESAVVPVALMTGEPIAPSVVKTEEKEIPRTAAIVGNKKRMEDIKSSPQVMSPIDELAYMDLVNFRRLDQSPSRRAAKIEEKINLLEKEGIDKKILGIRAWRNNPVSKTYLSMGQESISGGKNIDAIIKERQDQGLNYLSKEEFEAVMDLNDSLRF